MRPRGVGLVLVAAWLVLAVGLAEARAWPWLGVRIRDLSEQETEEIASRHGIREGFGAMIVDVLDGGAAARSGVRSGDLVVAFQGQPVIDTRALQRLVASAGVDQEVQLIVLRPGGRQTLRVRLGAMPRDVAGERVAAEFGFALRQGSAPGPSERAEPRVPTVAVVAPGSPAERSGLKAGDVILAVEERGVLTRDDARESLGDVAVDRPLRLAVRRGEERLSLTLPAP